MRPRTRRAADRRILGILLSQARNAGKPRPAPQPSPARESRSEFTANQQLQETRK